MLPATILHPDDYSTYLPAEVYLTDDRIHQKVRIVELEVLDKYRLTRRPNTGRVQAGNPGSVLPDQGIYRNRPLDRVYLRGYEWIRDDDRLAELTPRAAGPPAPGDPDEEVMAGYNQEVLSVGDPDIERMSAELLDALRLTIARVFQYSEERDSDILRIDEGERRVDFAENAGSRKRKLFRLLRPYNVKPGHTRL